MSHEHNGECLYCGTTNSYSSFNCCNCQTQLPWAQALTQMLAHNQPQPPGPLAPLQAQHQLAPVPPMHAHMQAQLAPSAQPTLAAASKYCAHCGSAHSAIAHFCSGCGTAILSAPQHSAPNAPRFAWSWPLQNATAPAPVAMAPAQGGYPAQAQGGFMFSPQQSVNVHVVTEQKTEQKRGGRGWLSRLFGFFFFTGCAGLALLALTGGSPSAFAVCVGVGLLAAFFAMLAKS